MAQAEADGMNGDVKSVRAQLGRVIPPSICTLSDINISGDRIIYTAACKGGTTNIVTTNYHGDHFDSLDSTGAKSEAKRVGACK